MTQILKASTSSAGWAALIIGIIGAICIGIYVMPQCVKIIKTKDTASISLGMFILSTVGAFSFVLMSIINAIDKKGGDLGAWLPIMLGNAFSGAASIVVVVIKVRNLKWSKQFGIKEDQIPAHFKEIKIALAKAKAEKEASKEKEEIDKIKSKTPVSSDTSSIVG